MKTTIGKVVALNEEIGLLLKEKLSFLTKFDINAFRKKLAPIVENFQETRKDIIIKYGEEKDGALQVKIENIDKFQTEIGKILEKEIDLKVKPFPASLFKGIKETEVAYNVLYDFVKFK